MTTPEFDPTLNLATKKVGAILNTSSGSCDLDSEQKMKDILAEAGITDPKIWCGAADNMNEAFKEAATHELDVFIVLGGDGTIRTAAEACSPGGSFFIPLPGGTMNMLPRALYGDLKWEDALRETLAHPQEKTVSGGKVGGSQFFIAAIFGAPAQWAEARESVREGDLWGAVQKGSTAFSNMFSSKVQYEISAELKGEAEAVSLICPLISEEMADSERALEAAVIDVDNVVEVLGLASSAAFGKWREDKNIQVTKTKLLKVSSNQEIPAILDGETVNLGKEASIEFVPVAFRALVPEIKK